MLRPEKYTLKSEKFTLEQVDIASRVMDSDVHICGEEWRGDVLQETVIRLSAFVAQGQQVEVKNETKTTKTHVAIVPKTAWDWLKQLIVEFEPTLCFGWLVPVLTEYTIPTEQQTCKTFWNVYPIQKGDVSVGRGHWPDKVEWLTTTPATDKDLRNARKQAQDNAVFMAVSELYPR